MIWCKRPSCAPSSARPRASTSPWKPWLVRVAVNLGKDALRRRKRLAYVGPWLPSPIEAEDYSLPSFEIPGEGGTEGRYDLLERLLRLSSGPRSPHPAAARGALLRDVFDYSVKEAADALGLSSPTSRPRTTARGAPSSPTIATAAAPPPTSSRARPRPSSASSAA